MTKQNELKEIDDFISEFNQQGKWGTLKRISDEKQENPDAICELSYNKTTRKIGLEATLAVTEKDIQEIINPSKFDPNKPLTPEEAFFNPLPGVEAVIKRAKEKSLNDYKSEGLKEVWLLISGATAISILDLEQRLKSENFTKKFSRIFVHKGLIGSGKNISLAEIIPI